MHFRSVGARALAVLLDHARAEPHEHPSGPADDARAFAGRFEAALHALRRSGSPPAEEQCILVFDKFTREISTLNVFILAFKIKFRVFGVWT